MNLLLDTHIFLWYITNDDRLPVAVADLLRQRTNRVYLSVVSVWEALVKHQLGKLPLPSPADEYLRNRREQHQFESLSLEEAAMSKLLELPDQHRDPFDRMLICQAMHHNLTMVSVDEHFAKYPITIIPAG